MAASGKEVVCLLFSQFRSHSLKTGNKAGVQGHSNKTVKFYTVHFAAFLSLIWQINKPWLCSVLLFLPSMISYSTAFPTPESPSTAWTWTIKEPWKGKRYRRNLFQVSSYWRKRSTSSTTVIASSWSNTFDECMFRPKVAWKYRRKCISWNTVYLWFVLWNGLEVNRSQETRRVITDIWNINDDRCLWLQRRISAILGKVKEIKN